MPQELRGRNEQANLGRKGGLIFVVCVLVALIAGWMWLGAQNKPISSADGAAQADLGPNSVESFDLESVLTGKGELEFCFPEGQDPNYPGVSACMQGFTWEDGIGYFDLINAGAGNTPISHGKLSISEIRDAVCVGFKLDSDLVAYMGVCTAKQAISQGLFGDWSIGQGQTFMAELFRDGSIGIFFQPKDILKKEIPNNSRLSNGPDKDMQHASELMSGDGLPNAAFTQQQQSPATTFNPIHIGDVSKVLELAKGTQTSDWGAETFKDCACTVTGNVIELSASSSIVLYNDADGPSVIAYTWEDNHGNPYTHFYQYNGSWVDVGQVVMPGYTGQYNDYFEATSKGITKWRGEGNEPEKYTYRSGVFVKLE